MCASAGKLTWTLLFTGNTSWLSGFDTHGGPRRNKAHSSIHARQRHAYEREIFDLGIGGGNNNDPERLKKWHLEPTREKQIRKSFTKVGERPKILIVTEKLLTGFDAP